MQRSELTIPVEEMFKKTPKDLPQVVPAQIRRVNNLISRRVNYYSRLNGVEDVTAMHGWILAYLYESRDREVFQRDVERAFSITRSTVTNILQLPGADRGGRPGPSADHAQPPPDRSVHFQPPHRGGKHRASPPAQQAAGRAGVNPAPLRALLNKM